MRSLKVSGWKEAAKVIYYFPSLDLGKDRREVRARETWEAMQMVPERWGSVLL